MKRFVYWYGSEKNGFSFVKPSNIISYEEGCSLGYNILPHKIVEKVRIDANSLTRKERVLYHGLEAIEEASKLDPKDRSFTNCEYEDIHFDGAQALKRKRDGASDPTKIRKKKRRRKNKTEISNQQQNRPKDNSSEQSLDSLISTSKEREEHMEIQETTMNSVSAGNSILATTQDIQREVNKRLGADKDRVTNDALAFACRVIDKKMKGDGKLDAVLNVMKRALRITSRPSFACHPSIDMPQVSDVMRDEYSNPDMMCYKELSVEQRDVLCIAVVLTQAGPAWETIQLSNLLKYVREAISSLEYLSWNRFYQIVELLIGKKLLTYARNRELALSSARHTNHVKVLVDLEDLELHLRRLLFKDDSLFAGMLRYIQKHDKDQQIVESNNSCEQVPKDLLQVLSIIMALRKFDPQRTFFALSNVVKYVRKQYPTHKYLTDHKFEKMIESLKEYDFIKVTNDGKNVMLNVEPKSIPLIDVVILEDLFGTNDRKKTRPMSVNTQVHNSIGLTEKYCAQVEIPSARPGSSSEWIVGLVSQLIDNPNGSFSSSSSATHASVLNSSTQYDFESTIKESELSMRVVFEV